MKKPVAEMTTLERWTVFFKYTPDKEKRELVNEIIKVEEGIAMAGQVLLNISKDEEERARIISEYKYIVDLQSKTVNARREGLEQGRQEGLERGMKRGVKQTARNALGTGMDTDTISKITGLTHGEIENLRNSLLL